MTDRQARDLPLDAHIHTNLSPDSNVADRRLRGVGARARDRRDRDHRPRRFRARRAGLRVTRRSRIANGSSAAPRNAGDRRASRSASASSSPTTARGRRTSATHLARHAYDFTIGSVHDRVDSPYNPRARRRLGRGPVAGRDRRALVRRGRGGCPVGAVRRHRPHRRRQALPLPARHAGRLRGRPGAVRADPPRPGRERDGARGQHERPALPDPAARSRIRRSSPASASSVGGRSRSAPTPTALEQLGWGLADGYAIAADAGFSELTFRRGPGAERDRRADSGRQRSLVNPTGIRASGRGTMRSNMTGRPNAVPGRSL